jgi:hypothetical protein
MISNIKGEGGGYRSESKEGVDYIMFQNTSENQKGVQRVNTCR